MPGPGFSYIGEEEEILVLKALRSRQLNRYHFDSVDPNQISLVDCFEHELADRIGSTYALGMNSCTSALVAVLKALSIGPGDEVVVPAYTFVATAAAVCHVGATPVFCDIDATLTLCPQAAEDLLTDQTKAIICVHMLGRACQMETLGALCQSRGLWLIEDVAQACGASFSGRPLGGWGIAGCFSFNIFKMITAGDGGAITTSDIGLYERAFAYHDHGFARQGMRVLDGDELLGMNYRMTELSGAVLTAQIRKLERILDDVRHRQKILQKALIFPPWVELACSHDPEGETGTALILRFSTPDLADEFASLTGTKPLILSGRHVYRNMSAVFRSGHSTAPESTLGTVSGLKLSRTDDFLARSVALGIGVVDHYLGTGLGVSSLASDEEVHDLAGRVNCALEAINEGHIERVCR